MAGNSNVTNEEANNIEAVAAKLLPSPTGCMALAHDLVRRSIHWYCGTVTRNRLRDAGL
jgi:hypothetical protein